MVLFSLGGYSCGINWGFLVGFRVFLRVRCRRKVGVSTYLDLTNIQHPIYGRTPPRDWSRCSYSLEAKKKIFVAILLLGESKWSRSERLRFQRDASSFFLFFFGSEWCASI